MAHADDTGESRSEFDTPTTHARTDRQSAGRSVETTPESLYLSRIAHLEARVETLQRDVELREQNLQHVIDHYEHVLDERAGTPDGELLTDGGRPTRRSDGLWTRLRRRVRALFE
jgi:hypothetical protein